MREEYAKVVDYNRTALIEVGIGELEPLYISLFL